MKIKIPLIGMRGINYFLGLILPLGIGELIHSSTHPSFKFSLPTLPYDNSTAFRYPELSWKGSSQ